MTGRTKTGLEIVCPELFARVPEAWLPRNGVLGALERLLSRADCRAERSGGLERNLCRRFGIEMADDEEVPGGALSLLADGANPGTGYWLRADPVRLHADRDRLILFVLNATTLHEGTASGYVDEFNRYFSPQGWRLIAPHPRRWYLGAPRPLELRTRSLREVRGRSVDSFLPSGADAPALRRLVTEAEMLLHEFFTAGAIATAGDQMANSLWLSGGGVLPLPGECRLSGVASDDPLVRGLARNARLNVASPLQPVTPYGRVLWFRDAVSDALSAEDASSYTAALGQIAEQCAAALASAQQGGLASVCLGDGVSRSCCASARQLRRWWRRRKQYQCFFL